MAGKDEPTVYRAVQSWAVAERLLGTELGEQRWQEHFAIVARLRRAYVRYTRMLGVLFGIGGGLGAYIINDTLHRQPALTVILFLFGFLASQSWSRLTRSTVAPEVRHPRHLWPRGAFLILYEFVLLVGLVLPANLVWSVVSAVAIAAPWWTSARLEARQVIPAYPAVWREFRPSVEA